MVIGNILIEAYFFHSFFLKRAMENLHSLDALLQIYH